MLIKYKTTAGDLMVEAEAAKGAKLVAGSGGVVKSTKELETALEGVKPFMVALCDTFSGLPKAPQEVSFEFGLKFSAELGAVIAGITSEAACKINVKWTGGK